MQFYKSITFKLFLLLFILLSLFAGIISYIHIFVIGRSYTISQYTLQKATELKPIIEDFATSIYNYKIRNNDYDTAGNYSMEAIAGIESPNNIHMITYASNRKGITMSAYTKDLVGSYGLKYIKQKVKELDNTTESRAIRNQIEYSQLGTKYLPLFRLNDKYDFPTNYIVQTACYKLVPGSNKYIIVLIPEVFTSKSSGMLKKYMVYILLLLLLLILGVSVIISYLVARPIIKINRTAAKIATLDFSEKCTVKGEDEIGNLSNTINSMSDSLQDNIAILNTANQKLNEDLNLQKELDMMRREFLGAVTHELKTPITLIKGYAESIIDEVAEGKDKEFALKTIINETENMDKLVKDLIDLSKLEATGYTLNITNFYADELLNRISSRYEKLITEREIQLNTSFEKCNIMVNGDSFRIEQVIANFMNNAIDNTPPNKNITLSLEITLNKAIISVHNEGKNIAESELSRIWEKFYRVEKSRNKKLGGTGLGLAVSKSILQLHNSEYGVKNTQTGVMFYFSLDIAKGFDTGDKLQQ